MNLTLRQKLLAAAAGGTLSIAVTLGAWYEGTGPTRKMADGSVQYGAYKDPAGIWTACHGITGPAIMPGRWYTQAECDVLESAAYKRAEESARRLFLGYSSLNKWQQAALLDMVFNLGEARLQGSTLQRKLAAGQIDAACDEMGRWVNARVGGVLVPLPGLVERRATAEELCMQ